MESTAHTPILSFSNTTPLRSARSPEMAHSRIGNHLDTPESQSTTGIDVDSHSLHHPLSDTKCPIRPCGGCSELAGAEAQVSIAEDMLRIARKRLARAKPHLNYWHDRLVARLPPEIISGIFIHVSSYDHQHLGYFPAIILASVCQRWREIALATPQLWTNIDINVYKHSAQPDIAQDLLLRSHSFPLYLSFYERTSEKSPSETTPLGPLMNLIRSHSARWKHICFENWFGDIPPILTLLLENLEVIPTSDSLELHLVKVDCLEPIALPEALRPRVFRSDTKDTIRNIPLQWDNLTHLTVEGSVDTNDVLGIIREAPGLIALSAQYLLVQAHPFLGITTIVHHCLKDLTLDRDIHPDDVDNDILPYLTLPALQHFYCRLDCSPGTLGPIAHGNIIEFLDRSDLKPGSLRAFELHYILAVESYDHRFVELAALTRLEIDIQCSDQSDVLHSYLCGLSDPNALPHLRQLIINLFGDAISPSPASWALLSDLCLDKTSNIGPSGTYLEENAPDQCTTDSINHLDNKVSLSLPGTAVARRQKRPLESLSVDGYLNLDANTMEKEVLLRFLEVQKAGVVKLRLRDQHWDDVLAIVATIHGCQSSL